eukprot:7744848-Lingulodinium_polyedra.AAC.1
MAAREHGQNGPGVTVNCLGFSSVRCVWCCRASSFNVPTSRVYNTLGYHNARRSLTVRMRIAAASITF